MHRAYAIVWEYIHEVNKFLHTREPWKIVRQSAPLVKTDMAQFTEIISATAHALYTIAHLCWPLMPTKMEQLLRQIGITAHPDTSSSSVEGLSGSYIFLSFIA